MEKLIVSQENVRDSKVFLYKKVNNLVYLFYPKTTAEQVMMSDGVDIEEKLIGISADVVQAASTAVEAFQKANQAFNSIPDLSAYATTASVNAALANKAGTAVASTTAAGLCPKLSGGTTNFLRADGTWAAPPDTNTTYAAATQSAAGLMSADDKKKLDGIAAGAQVNPTLPTVNSLFPSANNKPGHFAVFDNSYKNAGYLAFATAKSLLAPDLSGYATLNGCSFTGTVNFKCTYPICTYAPWDKSTYKDAPVHNAISFKDSSGSNIGIIRPYMTNTNGVGIQFVFAWNSKTHHCGFELMGDGTPIGYVASPPAASNTTHMATTAWSRARIAAATGKGATTFSLSPDVDTLALDDFCEWSPDMVTNDMLEAAKKVINQYSTRAIFYGFWYEFHDENYFFTYDLYDQQDFSDNAILALSGEDTSLLARTEANEMIKINLSPNEMLALHKYALKVHKQTYIDLSLERKNEILNIHSETELKEKMNEYGLLKEYKEHLQIANAVYLNEISAV